MSQHQLISRRNLFRIGAGSLTACLGTGALAQTISAPSAQAQQVEADSPTPDEALARLLDGNKRFVTRKQQYPNQDTARLQEVAQGQAPFAAILSCADSRVVPEIAFDQGIGDLFTVRVAGNLAVTEDIASEEFAVGVLGTPLLMVLGHERCGAVQAALEVTELPGVIESLVYAIRPAIEATEDMPGDRLTNAVKANVLLQIKRLRNSSIIAKAEQDGKLKVVGAYYDLDTGEISLVS